MPWNSVLVAAVLTLGSANMNTAMAFGRSMSDGAHFVGGGFAGHRFAISRGFPGRRFAIKHRLVRPFRRNFAVGGLWWPYYYYSASNNEYGATAATTYPGAADVVPEPIPAATCHRSEEKVRVPAESGGSREIKITNCPYGR